MGNGKPALVTAQIAAHEVAEPMDILQRQRLVEPVGVTDVRQHRRVAILAAERQRGIAGQRADPEKDEHAREQQHDQGGSDLA